MLNTLTFIEHSALACKWSRAVKVRRWMNHIGSRVSTAAAAAVSLTSKRDEDYAKMQRWVRTLFSHGR